MNYYNIKSTSKDQTIILFINHHSVWSPGIPCFQIFAWSLVFRHYLSLSMSLILCVIVLYICRWSGIIFFYATNQTLPFVVYVTDHALIFFVYVTNQTLPFFVCVTDFRCYFSLFMSLNRCHLSLFMSLISVLPFFVFVTYLRCSHYLFVYVSEA